MPFSVSFLSPDSLRTGYYALFTNCVCKLIFKRKCWWPH